MSKGLLNFCILLILCAGSGASCNRQWLNPYGQTGPVAPAILAEGAQLEQIATAINQNTARVQSLSAPAVTITLPGSSLIPPLRGNLSMERPQRFRLTAGTGLAGQEIDLGSNDELFWLWVRRNQPPAVYLCRHSQFAGSAAHEVMPIEPRWLQSALGLVELDPGLVYEGPTPRADGKLELRAHLPSGNGNLHRVMVIDASRAWVTEQHVYDTTGMTLIASAVTESHRYYPLQQVSLPDRVTVRLPTAGIALKISLGEVGINPANGISPQLWTLPPFEGVQQIDLGTLPRTPGTAPSFVPQPFSGLPVEGNVQVATEYTTIKR